MKNLPTVSMIVMAAVLLAGCGDSASEAKPKTASQSTPASTAVTTAPTPAATKQASAKEVLAKCLKKAKLGLAEEPSTTQDRVAVGAAGNLPALYIGVITYKGKPVIDVWQADDSAGGKETADMLNTAEAESEGVTEVEAAYNQGRAVSAPFNNLVITKLSDEQLDTLDGCVTQLNS